MVEFLGLFSNSLEWVYGLSLGGSELSSCDVLGSSRLIAWLLIGISVLFVLLL